jgi:hypothetical protein
VERLHTIRKPALLLVALACAIGCSSWDGARPMRGDVGNEMDASGEDPEQDADEEPWDAGEEDGEADATEDAEPLDAAVEAGPLCFDDSDCQGDEQYCYQQRDWDCDGYAAVMCARYRPGGVCAGECRTKTAAGLCRHGTCPRGYGCPPDIHGTQGSCIRSSGVGGSCLPYTGGCLEGLTCDLSTFTCTAGSSPPGTPCSEDRSCHGDAWCIDGACSAQSKRGEPCTRGSCGPSDYCEDPDGYGPVPGVCVEQSGESCSADACPAGTYCDDADGEGPVKGRCIALIMDYAPCRWGRSHECASGDCSLVSVAIGDAGVLADGGTVDTEWKNRCVPAIPEGADCAGPTTGLARCLDGLVCAGDGKCRVPLTVNAGCSRSPDAIPCAPGLWCSTATDTCVALGGDEGEPCALAGDACKSGLTCARADLTCDPNRGPPCARVCRAALPAGSHCQDRHECASDTCLRGTCTDDVCIRRQ